MTTKVVSAALLAAVLAACGGGGGGGAGTTPAPVPAVQITSTNANVVAAHALDSVQNTTTVDNGAGLLTGVEVQGGAAAGTAPVAKVLASVVRFSAENLTALPLATGVLTPTSGSAVCPQGGSASVSGAVASRGALTAGDNLTFQATSCSLIVDGVPVTLNGTMRFAVTSGFLNSASTTFHIVVSITTTNLSLSSGSTVLTSNGDLTLDWTHSSTTSDSLSVSGASLASGETKPSGFHSTTWSNYRQAVVLNGTAVTGSLAGLVATDNTRLGAAGGSYMVSTPQDLRWTTSSEVPVAGVIKAVGAGNSAIQVTFSAAGAAIQVDANGDGVYESTTNATVAQLQALL